MKKIVIFLGVILIVLVSVTSCKKEESDPCDDVSCLNGGVCNNGSCACALGYEGASCETQQRAKFIGIYNTSGCSENYTLAIASSSASVTNILLNFPSDFGLPPITANVTGSSMTIPLQNIIDEFGDAYSFSGSGTISSNTLTWTLTVVYDGFGDTCTYVSIKQ